jgi:putative FmdB family regulatory protein
MPIYEYTCSQCQKLSDVLQKLSEPAPERCPACGAEGTLSRVVSRTSFVLKGGGWGADLYASKKSAEKSDSPPPEGAKTPEKSGAPATGAAPVAAPSTTGSGSSSSAPASAPAPAKSSTSEKSEKSEKKDSGS